MPLAKKYKPNTRNKSKKYPGTKSGAAAVRKTRSQSGRGTRPRGTDSNMY